MSTIPDWVGWGDPVIERAARRVIEAGLGTGRSAIDSGEAAWEKSVAVDLHRRMIVEEDLGSGSFMSKLEVQLSGASWATHLLCAELLYLHVLPLTNVGADAKRKRISTVLGWARPDTVIPSELDEALGRPGVFNGGTGFNVQIWKQTGWLLLFVQHWWGQPDTERTKALDDPWAFREIVASMPGDQPGIRNSLLYLAFPKIFFPIVNQDHKRNVRNAFASLIGGATGIDPISIDRDLLAIHSKHQEMAGPEQIVSYYAEPYRSQWAKPKDEGMRAWLIRPRSPDIIELWRAEGLISVPATHLPELEPGSGLAKIRALVEESYRHVDYVQRLALATEFDIFSNRMKIDDIVAVVDGDRLHVGQITGEPERTQDDGGRFSRAAAWPESDPVSVAQLPQKLQVGLGQPGAIVDLTREIETLMPLAKAGESKTEIPVQSPDTKQRVTLLRAATAELAGNVHMDQSWLQRVIELLEDRRQIVLYGPPGTGKTFLARELAHHLTDGEAVRLVQFHPSYSYEDFFEGYRPDLTDSGTIAFKLRPGPMRQLASAAQANPERAHILIIDEINRGNLAKIFGELYFLLEYRDELIRLQYSPDEPFSLPPNVYVIATMNTTDRSIALIDAAMRRRFAFVELHPTAHPVRDVLERWLQAKGKPGDPRARLLQALNAEIGIEERDLQIGPSYLMTPENERRDGLARVWEHSILPVLEEHYYGRLTREEIHERFGLASIEAKTNPTDPADS